MIGIGLAKGEYEYPATHVRERDSKCMSQQLFLSACFALLGKERMEQLSRIGTSLPIRDKPWENLGELGRTLDPIRNPVKAWCSEVGLNNDWCYPTALIGVLVGTMKDDRASFDELVPLINKVKIERTLPERELSLDFGHWDVIEMTRQEFVRKARQQLEERLSEYTDEKEKEAQAAGLVKVPERRNIDTYFWLAGYQVLHWPIDHIAKAEHRERPTVGKQIRILASEIGLQLREANDYDPAQTADIIRDALRRARAKFKSLGASFIEEIPEAARNIVPPAFYQLVSSPAAEE